MAKCEKQSKLAVFLFARKCELWITCGQIILFKNKIKIKIKVLTIYYKVGYKGYVVDKCG